MSRPPLTSVPLAALLAAAEAAGGRLVVVDSAGQVGEKPEMDICPYQATKMEKAAAKRERKRLRNLRQTGQEEA